MREIKFRVWDVESSDMIQHKDLIIGDVYLQVSEEGMRVVMDDPDGENGPEVRDAVIMQFTGLKDKHGKEIYESDVVKAHDHPTGADDTTGEVYYEQGSWRVRGALCTLSEFGTAWTEVIGNIYENPELCQ